MKVVEIKPNPKNDKQAYVTLETGVVAWSPDYEAAKPFVGKELPEGWVFRPKDESHGPQLLPPKQKGAPQAAYRNTKDGQAYEQERMDRRTALMQAVTLHETHSDPNAENVIGWADSFYEWLRKTSGAGRAAGDSKALPASDTSSVTAVGADSTATAVDKPEGQASPLNGEAAGEPVPSAPNELWDKARELGLSPPKAVVMARRRGWDHVRTSTDLTDAQLAELILIRKEELA